MNIPATPLKAIRAKCLDCCLNQPKEVRLCTIPTCPLFPYRFGKKPENIAKQKTKQEEADD